MRALRKLSDEVYWFAQRDCWRFPYRDPCTRERRFLNCTADRFARAGIPLANPEMIRKQTKTAEQLAERLRIVFLASLEKTSPTEAFGSGPPKLSDAIAAYFALYEHAQAYRASLRTIFAEFATAVGDKRVDELRDVDLKGYEIRLASRGLSRTTVRSYIAQVGMLLNFAVKKGWTRQDPRLTYKPPKEELKDPNPFTDDELKRFFEFVRAPARFRPEGWDAMKWSGIGLLVLGLRPIELQGARWEHLSVENRFLFVDQSHGNKLEQARQWQPIPLVAWPLFVERRQERGPIWTGSRGEALTNHGMARMRRTLQRVFPAFAWKRFRKTYATILAAAGNDVVMVSRLLRHSAGGKNVSIAQRHYLGRSDNLLRAAADEAFEPYTAMVSGNAGAGTALKAVEGANATG